MESQANLLGSMLTVDNVLLDLNAHGRGEIFRAVAERWHRSHGLDESEVIAGLEMREELGSTGLGHGLAIPHARVKGLDKPLAAFVRLKNAIDFDAPDAEAVGDFFVLTVPSHATQVHLEILAEVAGKMSGTGFRDELRAANTAAEVVRLFSA
ncbi:MAG TPA: PTS sugar transporter subunit IIA [Burkholderiaceae bacterium]